MMRRRVVGFQGTSSISRDSNHSCRGSRVFIDRPIVRPHDSTKHVRYLGLPRVALSQPPEFESTGSSLRCSASSSRSLT
jgi:hypothetical protein